MEGAERCLLFLRAPSAVPSRPSFLISHLVLRPQFKSAKQEVALEDGIQDITYEDDGLMAWLMGASGGVVIGAWG